MLASISFNCLIAAPREFMSPLESIEEFMNMELGELFSKPKLWPAEAVNRYGIVVWMDMSLLVTVVVAVVMSGIEIEREITCCMLRIEAMYNGSHKEKRWKKIEMMYLCIVDAAVGFSIDLWIEMIARNRSHRESSILRLKK